MAGGTTAAARSYDPSATELTGAVRSVLTEKPETPWKEVHATLIEDNPTWRIPERRVAKFVKRHKTPSTDDGSSTRSGRSSLFSFRSSRSKSPRRKKAGGATLETPQSNNAAGNEGGAADVNTESKENATAPAATTSAAVLYDNKSPKSPKRSLKRLFSRNRADKKKSASNGDDVIQDAIPPPIETEAAAAPAVAAPKKKSMIRKLFGRRKDKSKKAADEAPEEVPIPTVSIPAESALENDTSLGESPPTSVVTMENNDEEDNHLLLPSAHLEEEEKEDEDEVNLFARTSNSSDSWLAPVEEEGVGDDSFEVVNPPSPVARGIAPVVQDTEPKSSRKERLFAFFTQIFVFLHKLYQSIVTRQQQLVRAAAASGLQQYLAPLGFAASGAAMLLWLATALGANVLGVLFAVVAGVYVLSSPSSDKDDNEPAEMPTASEPRQVEVVVSKEPPTIDEREMELPGLVESKSEEGVDPIYEYPPGVMPEESALKEEVSGQGSTSAVNEPQAVVIEPATVLLAVEAAPESSETNDTKQPVPSVVPTDVSKETSIDTFDKPMEDELPEAASPPAETAPVTEPQAEEVVEPLPTKAVSTGRFAVLSSPDAEEGPVDARAPPRSNQPQPLGNDPRQVSPSQSEQMLSLEESGVTCFALWAANNEVWNHNVWGTDFDAPVDDAPSDGEIQRTTDKGGGSGATADSASNDAADPDGGTETCALTCDETTVDPKRRISEQMPSDVPSASTVVPAEEDSAEREPPASDSPDKAAVGTEPVKGDEHAATDGSADFPVEEEAITNGEEQAPVDKSATKLDQEDVGSVEAAAVRTDSNEAIEPVNGDEQAATEESADLPVEEELTADGEEQAPVNKSDTKLGQEDVGFVEAAAVRTESNEATEQGGEQAATEESADLPVETESAANGEKQTQVGESDTKLGQEDIGPANAETSAEQGAGPTKNEEDGVQPDYPESESNTGKDEKSSSKPNTSSEGETDTPVDLSLEGDKPALLETGASSIESDEKKEESEVAQDEAIPAVDSVVEDTPIASIWNSEMTFEADV